MEGDDCGPHFGSYYECSVSHVRSHRWGGHHRREHRDSKAAYACYGGIIFHHSHGTFSSSFVSVLLHFVGTYSYFLESIKIGRKRKRVHMLLLITPVVSASCAWQCKFSRASFLLEDSVKRLCENSRTDKQTILASHIYLALCSCRRIQWKGCARILGARASRCTRQHIFISRHIYRTRSFSASRRWAISASTRAQIILVIFEILYGWVLGQLVKIKDMEANDHCSEQDKISVELARMTASSSVIYSRDHLLTRYQWH